MNHVADDHAVVPTILVDRGDDDKGKTATDSAEQDSNDEAVGMEDISWGEVCQTCCAYSPQEWRTLAVGVLLAMTSLYIFMLGLEFLSNGAKVMSGCKAGELFGEDANPFSSLMIGVLSTVMLQSSSTTTSIVVSLVGSVINASQGIFMVMGAVSEVTTNNLFANRATHDKSLNRL